ncbi:MAG: hypothetical protein ACI9G6_003361, partial [Limisphaerales bacterium]
KTNVFSFQTDKNFPQLFVFYHQSSTEYKKKT